MESKRGVDHTDSIRFPSLAADRQGPVIGGFERVPSPIPQFLPVFLRSPQPLPAQTGASRSLPRCILEPHEPAHTPIRLGFVFRPRFCALRALQSKITERTHRRTTPFSPI